MLVKFCRKYPDAKPPERASDGAVGYDVYAYHALDKKSRMPLGELPQILEPGKSMLIGTGIVFAVPFPTDCQVRPRSGLANKHDVELSNSPGTVDPDYRGEIGILLRNRGELPFTVEKGMRVAQLVFTKVELPEFQEDPDLIENSTKRGTGGFGSSGLTTMLLGGDKDFRAEIYRWDRYFMQVAIAASGLSDCLRGAERDKNGCYKKDADGRYCGATRKFGCVIVKDRNIISQGFNYRTSDCNEEIGCIRERDRIPSGTANDVGCFHAEQVAVQNHGKTGGPSLEGATVYVNSEPCVACAKLLMGCGIATVVVPGTVYPTNGLKYMSDAGIEVRKVDI